MRPTPQPGATATTRRSAARLARQSWPLLLALLAPVVMAQGLPDKPAEIMNNIVAMLAGIGVAVFTAACMWCGYKLAFAGAQFRDVSNILWGGILAGGAAGFAAWLFA